MTAEWLREREPRREAVRDLLADALVGTIRAATAPNADSPSR